MNSENPQFAEKSFTDPKKAFDYLEQIYYAQISYLRKAFTEFANGKNKGTKIRAYYPELKIDAKNAKRMDTRRSYGFVPKPGVYSTTVTRPDIFKYYLENHIQLLNKNHDCPIVVGLSDSAMPVHFALGDSFHLEESLTPEQLELIPAVFDRPDLDLMDDDIANNSYIHEFGKAKPLSLFTAPRIDLSLMRLRHYTGTSDIHFQNYIIYTNYQFYIDEFIKICRETMTSGTKKYGFLENQNYTAFVEPGNLITANKNLKKNKEKDNPGLMLKRMPQMPAYHLKREDGSGITMINIGVGPSNAKTISDHVAVLRPHAWLMLGHCAGLRNSQNLGDYVLAHGYLREDNVLNRDVDPSIPIPALAEIQLALEQAVSEITGYQGYDLKKIMRTGTVATTDDRNWELRSSVQQNRRLSQSRAIAMDMESGTVAANGFRFRVPYGTLLCVSDKPLHGQLKLPGMADHFYRSRVDQHLQIGLLAMTLLREIGPDKLHSRKLRAFNEVAFQ